MAEDNKKKDEKKSTKKKNDKYVYKTYRQLAKEKMQKEAVDEEEELKQVGAVRHLAKTFVNNPLFEEMKELEFPLNVFCFALGFVSSLLEFGIDKIVGNKYFEKNTGNLIKVCKDELKTNKPELITPETEQAINEMSKSCISDKDLEKIRNFEFVQFRDKEKKNLTWEDAKKNEKFTAWFKKNTGMEYSDYAKGVEEKLEKAKQEELEKTTKVTTMEEYSKDFEDDENEKEAQNPQNNSNNGSNNDAKKDENKKEEKIESKEEIKKEEIKNENNDSKKDDKKKEEKIESKEGIKKEEQNPQNNSNNASNNDSKKDDKKKDEKPKSITDNQLVNEFKNGVYDNKPKNTEPNKNESNEENKKINKNEEELENKDRQSIGEVDTSNSINDVEGEEKEEEEPDIEALKDSVFDDDANKSFSFNDEDELANEQKKIIDELNEETNPLNDPNDKKHKIYDSMNLDAMFGHEERKHSDGSFSLDGAKKETKEVVGGVTEAIKENNSSNASSKKENEKEKEPEEKDKDKQALGIFRHFATNFAQSPLIEACKELEFPLNFFCFALGLIGSILNTAIDKIAGNKYFPKGASNIAKDNKDAIGKNVKDEAEFDKALDQVTKDEEGNEIDNVEDFIKNLLNAKIKGKDGRTFDLDSIMNDKAFNKEFKKLTGQNFKDLAEKIQKDFKTQEKELQDKKEEKDLNKDEKINSENKEVDKEKTEVNKENNEVKNDVVQNKEPVKENTNDKKENVNENQILDNNNQGNNSGNNGSNDNDKENEKTKETREPIKLPDDKFSEFNPIASKEEVKSSLDLDKNKEKEVNLENSMENLNIDELAGRK